MAVYEVTPNGLAAQQGLQVGDVITAVQLPDPGQFHRMRSGHTVADAEFSVRLKDGRRITWQFGQLPSRSQRVYPAQLISSINADADLPLSCGPTTHSAGVTARYLRCWSPSIPCCGFSKR